MSQIDIDKLGKRIIERLGVLQLSQAEAARRAGVAPSWITDLVKGRKRSVRIDTLSGIARALLTSPAYLTGETSDPNPPGVGDAAQLGKMLPQVLASPAIGRMAAPGSDFVEPARANRGLLFRPHVPRHARPFFTTAMQETFERHWNETLGIDNRWQRIPLLVDPVADIPGAVRLFSGLPGATPSLPVLGTGGGAYALVMPDDSMSPLERGWLIYVKPGPTHFHGLVVLRLEHDRHGAIFMTRRLLEVTRTEVVAQTLSPSLEETIELTRVRSIHPIYQVGRDPAQYGPDEERHLTALVEETTQSIEAGMHEDGQD